MTKHPESTTCKVAKSFQPVITTCPDFLTHNGSKEVSTGNHQMLIWPKTDTKKLI